MDPNFLFYSGIASGLYTVYAFFSYYTYSGKNLITSKEAKNKIKKNKSIKIIDVRTQMEWDMGHYKNAIHIPTQKINKKELKKNNIKKNDTIIVYCNTGQRARKASEKIINLGYKNTFYIAGTYKSL